MVTKNPKIRPVSGIAGGVYSTLISAAVTVGIVPLLQEIRRPGLSAGLDGHHHRCFRAAPGVPAGKPVGYLPS